MRLAKLAENEKDSEKQNQHQMRAEEARSRLAEQNFEELKRWAADSQHRSSARASCRRTATRPRRRSSRRASRRAQQTARAAPADAGRARAHDGRRARHRRQAAPATPRAGAGIFDARGPAGRHRRGHGRGREGARRPARSRAKLLNALQRGRALEEKVALFRKQVEETDAEIRRLRRALRMLESNATLQALGPSKRELDDITADFEEKQRPCAAAEPVRRRCRAARGGERGRAAPQARGRGARGAREALGRRARRARPAVNREQGALRLEEGRADRADHRAQHGARERQEALQQVKIEARPPAQAHGKWVNRDVWNPGVMQRMQTEDLTSHLTHRGDRAARGHPQHAGERRPAQRREDGGHDRGRHGERQHPDDRRARGQGRRRRDRQRPRRRASARSSPR